MGQAPPGPRLPTAVIEATSAKYKEALRRLTGAANRLTAEQVSGAERLFAGDGEGLQQYRAGMDRALHIHVAANRHDLPQHVAQIARDGDFMHRIGNLTRLHPEPAGTRANNRR